MSRLQCLLVAISLAVLPLSADPTRSSAAGHLTSSLGTETVSFSGVTAGGDLVLFGAAIRSQFGTIIRAQVTELLTDADRDGTVAYAPQGGVPLRSVWVGVDTASGELLLLSPDGSRLSHASVPVGQLKEDGDGPWALELERFSAFILIVRPGTGAWMYTGAQNGRKDRGPSDGRLTATFGDAEPVGGKKEKAPKRLKRGDIVAVLDPSRLELRAWTLEK